MLCYNMRKMNRKGVLLMQKRILCLILAVVLVLGLVTSGILALVG